MRDRMDIVEELFALAAALPPTERRDLLDRRCAGDDALREEVEGLLEYDGSMPDGFLDSLFSGADPRALPGSGDLIAGRYRLVRELGHGGMGVVFLAEQCEPVRRRVALKLLRSGHNSRQVIARFRAERQALAMMEHPNIASVLDAGAAEHGHPYFVMEVIDGPPLTEFCDRAGSSIPERLGLFLQVCDAVQHAHTKGVIHRDLKPSNILTAVREGGPSPRVIDFGIAKAMERPADAAVSTQHGQAVGTPEYMSPEQAASDPDIDTRTDVYSLGAVLYELLTGRPPFGADAVGSCWSSNVERTNRQSEPQRPSSRVLADAGSEEGAAGVEERARRRGESPASLSQLLRGDLDWVVRKAMERERPRRYQTVAELAADVRRYLASEPVEARPPSPAYLASRFIRRHRPMVLGCVLAFAALASSSIATGVLAVRESAAHEQAKRSAQEASLASAESQAVGLFLEEMLTSARSIGASGANVTMLDMLGATERRLDDGALLDQPDVECRVRQILAESYLDLGWAPRAVPHLRWAAEHIEARDGDGAEATLVALWDYAEALKEAHESSEALELFERCYSMAMQALGPEDARTWYILDDIGNTLMRVGRPTEALPMHQRAYSALVRLSGEDDPGTALPLFNQAGTLRMMRRYDDAIPVYRRVIALFDRSNAENWTSNVRARHELGGVYIALDRFDDAIAVLDEAMDVSMRKLGPDHGETAATHLSRSRLFWRLARFDQAVPEFQLYIEFLRRLHGEDSGTVLQAQIELASMLIGAGEPGAAADLLQTTADLLLVAEDSIATAEEWPGVQRRTVDRAISLRCLGLALSQLGRYEEAEQASREALELVTASVPEGHRDRIESERVLCDALVGQGRADEAIERLGRIHAHAAATSKVLASRTAVSLAKCLEELGRVDEARGVLASAPPPERWRLDVGDRYLPRVLPCP